MNERYSLGARNIFSLNVYMWKRGSGGHLEISNKMESFASYGSRIFFFSPFLRPYYF